MKSISTILFFTLTSVFSYAQYDTLNFEVAANAIKIDSITGCWQIGKPSKTIFDTAYSPRHAIITDTLNPYPDNTYSTFDVSFPVNTGSAFYSIHFTHRYDTESGKDGGYILFYDCVSLQWINLLTGTTAYSCFNPYGAQFNSLPPAATLYNGQKGYTGNSGGWVTDELFFPCAAVRSGTPDTIQLRFVFVSDTVNTGHEGWMIDNLVFYNPGGACGNVEETLNERTVKLFPNPAGNTLTLESISKESVRKIDIVDTEGKNVLSLSPKNFDHRMNIDIDFLRSGVYMVRINDAAYSGYFVKL